MIVYVLESGEYSGRGISGIFATLGAAMKHGNDYEERRPFAWVCEGVRDHQGTIFSESYWAEWLQAPAFVTRPNGDGSTRQEIAYTPMTGPALFITAWDVETGEK